MTYEEIEAKAKRLGAAGFRLKVEEEPAGWAWQWRHPVIGVYPREETTIGTRAVAVVLAIEGLTA